MSDPEVRPNSTAAYEVEAPPPLYAPLYNRVKELILSGRIGPGVKLDEDKLAQMFGVSRTPVREAIRRLVHEGIVRARPRRGAYVISYSKKEILEILIVREQLEGLVARLAATNLDEATLDALVHMFEPARAQELLRTDPAALARLDQKFHQILFESTSNQCLIEIMRQLNDRMQLVRMKTIFLPGRLESSLRETDAIIAALVAHDPGQADQCARQHIQCARDAVERLYWDNEWERGELE